MARPKEIKNSTTIRVVISKEHAQHIEKIARKIALIEGKRYTVSHAIRDALEQCYPMAKQMEMF